MTEAYQLQHPITLRSKAQGAEIREELVSEVTIRRLKAKDMRMLDKIQGKFAQSLAVISALTGLSPQAVDELDAEDVEALGARVGDFFPRRQETGEGFSEA